MAGVDKSTVSLWAKNCNDFIAALKEGRENLANIGLSGVVEIATDPEHPKRLDACQTLLKHERSGGFGAERHEIAFIPSEALESLKP